MHSHVVRLSNVPQRLEHSLTIMQFNVLSDLLSPAPVNASQEAIDAVDAAKRRELNLKHITTLQPDLVVLEEVPDPESFYAPELAKHGYECIADRKAGGQGDFTCVFFQRARISNASAHHVFRFAEGTSQFALMCHLTDLLNDEEFVVVAQHAKAGRNDNSEEIRLRHAQRILTEALPPFLASTIQRQQLADAGKDFGRHILWLGDFNAGPHTYEGKWPAKVVPWLLGEHRASEVQPPIEFASAMKAFFGEHPLFTTCKMRDGQLLSQCIDYVMFPRDAAVCIGALPCPTTKPESDLAPLYLPNTTWGSDHLSVYIELMWKK